ncbi:MAG: diaminopimelate epimerase [Kofleriaceae bacterium]
MAAARTLPFAKYHGLGNDFVVVDLRGDVDAELAAAIQTDDVVAAVCDRQFGVGGDGVLAILAPTSAGAVARMRVLNADGGEAEMCGNGLRCVAKYLRERGGATGDTLVIDTGAGPLTCTLHPGGDQVATVTVDMGRPRLTRGELPMTGPADERFVAQPLELPGVAPRAFTAVSMGNPHAITFVDDGADLRQLALTAGRALEHHPTFPRRTNVEYAAMRSPRELDLVVWERGSGLTLACGTGACATAVAACLTGRATVGDELTVNLPGGALAITVAADYATVTMRGPATHVFDGTLAPLARLAERRPS